MTAVPRQPRGRRAPGLLAAGLLLTLVAGFFHIRLALRAGGLWRDEVNSLQVALAPTLGGLWALLDSEPFPALWHLILRAWTALAGPDDASLRALGATIGLSLVAVLWVAGRRMGLSAPVASLALVALHPDVLRWGDSMRAYGLGALFILLLFEAVWQAAAATTTARLVWAAAIAVGCVQALYANAFLVLAIFVSGAVLAFRRGARRDSALVLVAAAPAALSLLPYLGIVGRESATLASPGPLPLMSLLTRVGRTFGSQHVVMEAVWGGLALATLAGLIWAFRSSSDRDPVAVERVGYSALAVVLGAGLLLLFFRQLGYPTQAWYYLSLIALFGLALDAMSAVVLRRRRVRQAVAVAALVIAALAADSLWKKTGKRFTRTDAIADYVEAEATSADRVVVLPAYLGISFAHYYQGKAPWSSLPPLSDHRVHRMDLMRDHLSAEAPIQGVLDDVEAALMRGGRVYIVRMIRPLRPREAPLMLPPAPPGRGNLMRYDAAWASQLDAHLRRSATVSRVLSFPELGPVGLNEPPILQVLKRAPPPGGAGAENAAGGTP